MKMVAKIRLRGTVFTAFSKNSHVADILGNLGKSSGEE